MTTLKKLAYQAQRLLNAGPQPRDSKLSIAYLITELRQCANGAIKKEYYQVLGSGERAVYPVCIATYRDSQVQNDTTFGRNYISLPAIPLNLPGGVGVQQVRPQTGNPAIDRAMIPIMPHELEMFSSSLVGSEVLRDQWTFEVDRDKVWFSEKNNETLLEAGIEKVELKQVVIDPSQIGEDDTLPLDPAQEMEVLREVLLLHGYTAKEIPDLTNDGNPTSK